LKSIVRHVLENGLRRELRLYWGVRNQRDLYAHASLEETACRAADFHYVPVLSEPESSWRGRRGWVHEAALADLGRLEAFDVYASGPPAMIEAVRRDFARAGVEASRLLFDSFDYAPDSVARHRRMADTKL
jgi:CDP-4-dehydro-6-deoxyglucose reductase